MKPFEGLLTIAGPAVIAFLGAGTALAVGVTRGPGVGVDAITALLLPFFWGCIGLALFSGAARTIREAHAFVVIFLASGLGAAHVVMAFAGVEPVVVVEFALGSMLGTFTFLQTPDVPTADLKDDVLPRTADGVVLVNAGVLTGFALLILAI